MEEYTIKQAAERLDISKRTVRRRIKKGEIKAEKKEGPYGEQYFIPKSEIDSQTANQIIETVKVNKPIPKKEIKELITKEIRKTVSQEVNEVKEEIKQEIKDQNKKLKDDIKDNYKKRIKELEKENKKLKKQQNKSLLDRIKNLF